MSKSLESGLPSKAEFKIRQEEPGDFEAIRELVIQAFENAEHSDGTEAELVERLRASIHYIPELTLVAEYDQKVVGHIMMTKIEVVDRGASHPGLALAPVSVAPACQRRGVGSALIESVHELARKNQYRFSVLIGHADYYPRFGYLPASKFDVTFPFEVPDENGMLAELIPGAAESVVGLVTYPPEFFGND